MLDSEIYFKYHEAKDRENLGVMFKRQADEEAEWLDDFKDAKWSSFIDRECSLLLAGGN